MITDNILAQAVLKSQIGVIITDYNGVTVFANNSILEMTGHTWEDFVGKKPGAVLQGPQTSPEQRQVLREGISSLRPFETEILNYKKSGEKIWIKLKITPLINDDGKVTHFVGIQDDITQLKEQNEQLTSFNYIVSHNLTNQINNINGLINIIFGKGRNADNPNSNLLVTTSTKLVETFQALKRMLEVRRSISDLKNDHILLKELFNEVQTIINKSLVKHNIYIEYDVPDDLSIISYKPYLESIILNLLTNAIKYRDKNKKSSISVIANNNQDMITISVVDNGIGIDMIKNQKKLFTIFSTFHTNSDALGIGLYLIKKQTEALGGEIMATSKLGEGSVFNISLPQKKL